MRRRAAFRQCDVARALRAAKSAGATRVVVQLDGAISIELVEAQDAYGRPLNQRSAGKPEEIVL